MPSHFLTILFRYAGICAVVVLACGWALGGCAGSQPYAAAAHRPLTAEEEQAKPVLDAAEQAEVRRILRSIAGDGQPTSAPGPAPLGMRFSDVPDAVRTACADVEMAVVSTSQVDDAYVFSLKTIEDWPAELNVKRTSDERVYMATVTVGRFGDHLARAEALLTALEKQMRAFGAKRGFNRDHPD